LKLEAIMAKKTKKKQKAQDIYKAKQPKKMKRQAYESELAKLEVELVKLHVY